MARNDRFAFNQAKVWLLDGTLDMDTGPFKLAILDDTTTPLATDASPILATYTEVGSGGTYTAGGIALASPTLTEAAGVVTFDSTTNPSVLKDPANDVDAHWGFIYQEGTFNAIVNPGFYVVDLGGPVDMQNSDLAITWNAAGIMTLT